jgi:hypothetical protein
VRRNRVALHHPVRKICELMNHQPRIRFRHPFAVAAVFLFAATACQQKKPPVVEQVTPTEHVAPSPQGTSTVVVHKAFTVRTSITFPFEVPARAAMPRLRGSYKSFVTKLGVQSNEDSANVDFFVFNEDQYADFLHGAAGDSLFLADASHDQAVDVGLPPTMNESRKYYLVFRNTPGGDAKKAVQADLSVDF